MPNHPYKPRIESSELRMLRFLYPRMELEEKDKQRYYTLKKGYEGEVLFDSMTENLKCDCLILNDLLIKINGTTFQIDTLIITSEIIYFSDVKNFEGDYYFESDLFYKRPKTEYTNPLLQLLRSASLLRQMLSKLGINMPIDGSLVFINPDFTLYQAPLDQPIILPNQVHRYFKKLDSISSKLTGKHKMLADRLVSLHIIDSPFEQRPSYHYDQLRKGMTCEKCNSFSIFVDGKKSVCKDCGHQEVVGEAVMRTVRGFQLLFPNQKITTPVIHDLCGGGVSKKWIRGILERNLKIVGNRRWSYYEDTMD